MLATVRVRYSRVGNRTLPGTLELARTDPQKRFTAVKNVNVGYDAIPGGTTA
jgi:hypothetical protein